MRGQAILHPDWTFCSLSAAIAHGLEVSGIEPGVTYVATTPQAHSRSSTQVKRHVIPDDEFTRASGIPVTSLWQTVFDAIRDSDFPHALAIADSVLRVTGVGRDELAEQLERVGHGRQGKGAVLLVVSYADGRSENGGESVARGIMIEQGFAIPNLQVEIFDQTTGRTYRVDFLWLLPDGTYVAGELDGYDKYFDSTMTMGRPVVQVLIDERHRESRVSLAVSSIARFSFDTVLDTPRFVRELESHGIPRTTIPGDGGGIVIP